MSYELIPAAPDPWHQIATTVADTVFSPNSRRAYRRALLQFRRWYDAGPRGPFSKVLVQEYGTHLQQAGYAPSTISQSISILRRLALEAADNGLLDPAVAAAISRVRGPRRRGTRLGNWLALEEVQRLLNAPDLATLQGRRDQALLALLVGTGLRRNELAGLTVEQLQERDGRRIIVDLFGKHHRVRSVAVPSWAWASLQVWLAAAGISEGRLFRAINKADHLVRDRIGAQAVYEIVMTYACRLGLRLAPHDLRRTHARLARDGGASLEQIQIALGHSSISTTERYLGLRQNLTDAPGDHIAVQLKAS